MNRISRFIYAALVVFSAVACHTSEIDNPNKDNPDKPQISDNIQLTASIKQTRVEYSINGEKLEQKWTVGDAIYGFYGGKIANKIVFSVESVDEDTGVASLKPESGWSDFLSAFKANNSLPVGLVYTGCTTSEIPENFLSDGTIEVDMTTQGTDRIPACMHANIFSSRTVDDVTYVTFLFENDCSIIEVFSFTGVAEDYDTYLVGDSATLSSIEVDSLIEGCKYSLDNDGKLQFEAIDKTEGDDVPTTVTLGDSWSVTKYGDITYGDNIKPVFIAAVPSEYENFTVSANLEDGNPISVPFNNKTFVGGNSYYIMASPVVARTADGVYFKTVTDAFEHADDLYHADYNTAAKNIVTLVRDCGLAGVEPEDGEYKPLVGESAPIDIDGYDVTLDLNGHTLTLNNEECFRVNYDDEEDGWTGLINIFTIKDSGGDGKITSSGDSIIYNYGEVNIKGGTIQSDDYYVVDNYGTLKVMGGEISSGEGMTIFSEGVGNLAPEVRISGGYIYSCGDYCEAVTGGDVIITGGTIKSYGEESSAISTNGQIDISGKSSCIESDKWVAISAIKGAVLTMSGGKVSGALGGIQLTEGSTGTITGGTITIESTEQGEAEDGYALYIENSTCTISGGTIKNESTKKPAIYCFTGVDDKDDIDVPNLIITWTNGENEDDGGPLVYSSTQVFDGFKSFGAVSTCNKDPEDVNNDGKVDDDKCNWAIVEISGGYLYSSDDAIYSIAGESKVERPDGTYFYTNEASEDQDLKSKPHYFDFNKTAGSNLVSVPYLEGTSITDPVLGTLTFEYKIIPGEGPDVDTNITGGTLGPFDKIYF